MKRLVYILLCAASFLLPHSLQAQDRAIASDFDVGRIAVVDLNSILRDAQATETVRELLDEKRAEFELEFTEKEAKLLDLERDLQEQRAIMSEQEFANAVAEFQQSVTIVQRDIQTKRQALDKAFQDSQDSLRAFALEEIKTLAGEQRIDIVFDRNNAIIFRQELDISGAILTRLDERTRNARLISITE